LGKTFFEKRGLKPGGLKPGGLKPGGLKPDGLKALVPPKKNLFQKTGF